MSPTQDFPLYTTDPTTGELVPVENGQYLSPAEIERRRYFQKKKQQQAIRHAANDERTRKFGNFTFCRYTPSAPFWADMSNADLLILCSNGERAGILPLVLSNMLCYIIGVKVFF